MRLTGGAEGVLERLVRTAAATALVALAACGHTDAFTTPDAPPAGPFQDGEPARLTLSGADDMTPAWLADGSGIAYTYALSAAGTTDRCIGVLPPAGGARIAERCSSSVHEADSVDIFSEPAPLPDGRMAWVHGASRVGALGGPAYQRIELGATDPRVPVATLGSLPLPLSDGHVRNWLSQLRWLDGTHGILIAGDSGNVAPCPGCRVVPFASGRELVRVALTAGGAAFDPVPGTDEASSVATGETADVAYFTRNGDSRVYRLQLSSGAVTVAHDFGAVGIARDVQVANGTLWAVVGGLVQLLPTADGDVAQMDRGGGIVAVDLASGAERPVGAEASLLFRRLAVAPSGAALAASGIAVSITFPDAERQPELKDTTVLSGADIWRFARP